MGQDPALRSRPPIEPSGDLDPLLELVASCFCRGCVATASMVGNLPEPLSTFALSSRWLVPSGLLTVWRCEECDEPHTCDVNRSRDGTYSYLCLHNGRLTLTPKQLQTYALDWNAVLGTIAGSIGRSERSISRYAADRLYKIGYVNGEADKDGWTLGFSLGLEDATTLSNVLHALRTSFSKGPGLIATIGQNPSGEVRVDGYLFADASKLFRLQLDRIVLVQLEASRALFGSESVPEKTGAKSRSAKIAQIRKTLIEAGQWPHRRDAQVRSIRSGWTKSMGKIPAATSIPRNLREIEEAEREGRELA